MAAQLQAGEIELVGRTEAAVSADIGARLIAEGHDVVNFAIVAAGANAASPHHHASVRVIRAGELVLCDFGGTMAGYCSDITRCVSLGPPPAEVAEAYAVLHEAQAAGVAAAVVGAACEDVDRASRRVIDDAGFGEWFIHRTGHGIGMEAHEDPYMVEGNSLPIAAGHAFSVEPGIYLDGRWGMRLEDCVVATADGPLPLNRADHVAGGARRLRRVRRRRSRSASRGAGARAPRGRRVAGERRHRHVDVAVGQLGQHAVVEHAVARRAAGLDDVDAARRLAGDLLGARRRRADLRRGVDAQAVGGVGGVEVDGQLAVADRRGVEAGGALVAAAGLDHVRASARSGRRRS